MGMTMYSKLTKFASIILMLMLTGCATTSAMQQLPIRTATIIDTQPSMRKTFTPSGGGALAGGVAGGVVGNQIGKGNGKKLATVLGAVAGAVAGSAANGTTATVPISLVVMRDDETGEVFKGALDGAWQLGMKVRFSKDGDKIVVR